MLLALVIGANVTQHLGPLTYPRRINNAHGTISTMNPRLVY